MTDGNPFISIILPVKNAGGTVETTLSYLSKIDYPIEKMEIVFSDGGSTDKTKDIIKQKQQKDPYIKLVELVNCPSPGYARNRALEHVKGEFIFFTDGDCAPCTDWIKRMLNHFYRDDLIGLVGGEIFTLMVEPDNLVELYCENFGFNRVSWRYGGIGEGCFPDLKDHLPTSIAGHRAYFFVTANMSCRRELFTKEGLKFWDYPTGEDVEFSYQARLKGWKLYFDPKASVDHMHRSSFPALRKVWQSYGAGQGPLLKAHAEKKLEIVFQFIKGLPQISIPFPLKGFIYLGSFHMTHISIFFSFVFFIIGMFISGFGICEILSIIFFLLSIYFFYPFHLHAYYMNPRKHYFTWLRYKYLTNWEFIKGGLKRFFKDKVICIEPSF
ncbi:MAG: glycosyltransferase [bacterium]